jgi:molecular chaperone DnaJ
LQLKDYYTILELPPTASLDEVKKAYRRLAHQYHPDKKGNDPYAAARFSDIKEAYETLTNPTKKEIYLQQRWYAKSTGHQSTHEAVTPVSILKQLLELDRYSRTLDVHRLDKTGLYEYISQLLSYENIEKLNSFKEPGINREIILSLLKTARLLPWPLVSTLSERLKKIELADEDTAKKISVFIRQSRQADYWEKRRVWVVLAVVVLLCVAIFLTARN